jgi:hypothetical protein
MKLIFYLCELTVKEYLGVGGGDYELVVEPLFWEWELKKL